MCAKGDGRNKTLCGGKRAGYKGGEEGSGKQTMTVMRSGEKNEIRGVAWQKVQNVKNVEMKFERKGER